MSGIKIYFVRVTSLGADSSRVFYFRSYDRAEKCYHFFNCADDIVCIDMDDDFPLDMFSDSSF